MSKAASDDGQYTVIVQYQKQKLSNLNDSPMEVYKNVSGVAIQKDESMFKFQKNPFPKEVFRSPRNNKKQHNY